MLSGARADTRVRIQHIETTQILLFVLAYDWCVDKKDSAGTAKPSPKMRRASYRYGIFWIAENDDNLWIANNEDTASVTASLLADLFGVDTERVRRDIKRYLKRKGS